MDVASLERKSGEAAGLLTGMANPRRLQILCNLLDGERTVSDLVGRVGLGQSALSQHLSKLRAARMVETRRDGQSVYYRLASPAVRDVLATLYRIYCEPAGA